jgi:curved DNA-binding protein CbpA
MSFTKRVLDVAKANLNALLDKAGAPPDLENLSDAELEAELDRRKQRRLRESDEQRARESAERAARERAAQRATDKAKDRMSNVEAEFERLKQRAAAGEKTPPPASKQSKQREQQRRPPPPRTGAGMSEKRLRDLYAQLETPYGAPFEDVKKSFRRLMRKYHPDLHVGDPVKHKTATQLSMSLTTAYNELEIHLTGRK